VTRLALAADPTSPGRARRAVEREFGRCRPEFVEIAALLVTELVTNAVVHAHTKMVVRLERREDRVRVEVQDRSSNLPSVRGPIPPGDPESGGRGLALVERLADGWGVERRRRGKVVWFELRVPGIGRRSGSLSRRARRTR
jgi:anti-sigma regulatory factor (Ser/Thr protein kinase)